jgi:DNA/RNA-binding domain of Phe-tRNA-synthetase-like protein
MFETPIVDPRIAAIAPDFRAVSLVVDSGQAPQAEPGADPLAQACAAVLAGEPAWAEAHLAQWAEVFARFGARPSRTPCSAQALRKRVLKEGRLPSINPLVDLYNAVSLLYAVPVGGEKADAYAGPPRLTIADGSEPFDTFVNGEPAIEQPAPGEVIWRDDAGVTCRRWNWRQGRRTRLERGAGRMWFILESLGAMPQAELEEAADRLCEGLRESMPACAIARETVGFR